jgi:prepilin-type N-terminal cleavage/methylation domain-containing protein
MKIFKNIKSTKNQTQKGFTLLEILIALPIASMLSLVIAGTMFNQYGQYALDLEWREKSCFCH